MVTKGEEVENFLGRGRRRWKEEKKVVTKEDGVKFFSRKRKDEKDEKGKAEW